MLYEKMLFLLKEKQKNASTSYNRTLANDVSRLLELDHSWKVILHWILSWFKPRP